MADWQTVRFDPTYVEPLDPEIVPLCDVLNAAGFVTTQSCCGHGGDWPRVWFEHSADERIERLARFVLRAAEGDFRPFAASFRKEILPEGYLWCLELHLNNVYRDTPADLWLREAKSALATVTDLVGAFAATGVPMGANRLHSSPMLHHPPADDDRSAVTFWLPKSAARRESLAVAFEEMAVRVREARPETGLD